MQAKLRSFSYGALPGLDELGKRIAETTAPEKTAAAQAEDDDSGILLNDPPADAANGTPADTGAQGGYCFRSASQYGAKRHYALSLPRDGRPPAGPRPSGGAKAYRAVLLNRDRPEQVLGVRIKEVRSEGSFGYVVVNIAPGGVADR